MRLTLVAIGVVIIYRYYPFAFKGKVPESPAALGRAFAAPTFILGLSLYCLGIVQNWLITPLIGDVPIGKVLGYAIAILCSAAAGWVAARTTEDTQSMNMKIICVAAFFPYALVIYIAYMSSPAWVIWSLLALFVPVVIIGNRAYVKSAQAGN